MVTRLPGDFGRTTAGAGHESWAREVPQTSEVPRHVICRLALEMLDDQNTFGTRLGFGLRQSSGDASWTYAQMTARKLASSNDKNCDTDDSHLPCCSSNVHQAHEAVLVSVAF